MAGWYSSWLPVDGLATLEKVRASLLNLPPTAQLEVIPGGIHAFFGRYGAQAGDGQPTISREVFEAAVLERLSVFLEKIR
jgi:dienelactone hydrolase